MKLYDYTFNSGNCVIHNVEAYYNCNREFYKIVAALIDAQEGPLPGLKDITYWATCDKQEDMLCLSVHSAGIPVWIAHICKTENTMKVACDTLREISQRFTMDFPNMGCKLPQSIKLPCIITYTLPTAALVPFEVGFILGGVPRDFAIAYLNRKGE